MKTNVLLNKLARRFPKRIAKDNHDHVGLMVGKKPEEFHKVLLCLDMDWQVLPIVKKERPDIIITHHPFFFGSKAKILKYVDSKRLLNNELENLGVTLYSYHTNFDTGKGGMNDALSEALGLKDVYAPIKNPMMRIGYLENEMDIMDFCQMAKERFHVDYSLLVHNGAKTIKKVGIIGGGGSRSYALAKEEGCDIYISGDAPHHVRREIIDENFNYLDMPHEIEKIFMPTMKKILLEMDDSLEIIIVDHEKEPTVI
ncbi:MAG: Nif3-like dinuclear metal center hexameric protein [Bacilli bacterium]|nr:Nif3-like dinuclear metal center hexameric protein [Bacilli bacterium]